MPLQTYEQLDVYKQSFDLAVNIHQFTSKFPKEELYGGIAGQMRRSSKSICANIAEGLAKQMSVADKRRYLSIALGSAEETRVWLSFCSTLGYLPQNKANELRHDYAQIAKMLYKLDKSLTF